MNILLLTNCSAATMGEGAPYGLISDAAIAIAGETIAWVGPRHHLPQSLASQWTKEMDLKGAVVTPGLIDCHTHLVYGGTRAHEFELRLNGASYEEVARAGGGIASSVRETRAATASELLTQSARRLKALIDEGVTTVEIKSGYGLSLEQERKCLVVARSLADTHAVDVCMTFLGAHALPPEFAGKSDDYIDSVVEMLRALHAEGLIDAVDGFCERIAFSSAQIERVFAVAKELGLPVKLHAEQLSDAGGAVLASAYGALSCDHLEWLSEAGAKAMSQSGVTAVLLPIAFYFLRETKAPPINLLRQLGIAMAVSTDCNPGTSPSTSLLLAMNMACILFRLTPEEALVGATRNAAKALGLNDRGALMPGMRADLVAWDVRHPREIPYAVGGNPRRFTVVKGRIT